MNSARGSSPVTSWLRHTADELGMELDENDNSSVMAVLREIDRRLAAYVEPGRISVTEIDHEITALQRALNYEDNR